MIALRRVRWTGHVAHMEKKRNAYRVLVGKCKEQRQLGRLTLMWHGVDLSVLCYKSEGCWFDPSWCHWIFH